MSSNGDFQYKAGTDYTIKAQVGENPSTGYIWKIASNTCGARVALTKTESHKAGDLKLDQMYGAGNVRTFTFKTLGPDANFIRGMPCDIEFISVRPWESNANVADNNKRKVTINVE